MRFTIFGGKGFIGSALDRFLTSRGHDVIVPERNILEISRDNLGHVIYSIGLTSDFRNRPLDTIEAHVCLLNRLIQNAQFDSWLYLSSTRVYSGLEDKKVNEDTPLKVIPDEDGIYNLSKLTGEAICLTQANNKIRVARIANVFGPQQPEHTFLGLLLNEVKKGKEIKILEGALSLKDYIFINDVCRYLEYIAIKGKYRIYNVASGVRVSHQDIAKAIDLLISTKVNFLQEASIRSFPQIDVTRLISEIKIKPKKLIESLKMGEITI